MPFEKGRQKTGGRVSGVTNQSTSIVRDSFKQLVEGNLQRIEKDLEELEPKDRVKMILELAKFVIPTLKAEELKVDGESRLPSYLLNDDALNELLKKK